MTWHDTIGGLLAGRSAIVTGAASPRGLGFGIARALAAAGARVSLLDLDEAAVSAAAEQLPGSGHLGFACDVTRPEPCCETVARIAEATGGVDVLVNNAGVSQPRKLMEIDQAGYDLVLDVSLRGALNMCQAASPHLRRPGASIICMGSVSGERGGGVMGGPHYSAAKSAVHGFARALARELGADGIRVNAIAPGLIDTDLIAGRLPDAARARVIESVPLGRIGIPADVAGAALFLASDLSAYVTGTTLDVNGGLHIH